MEIVDIPDPILGIIINLTGESYRGREFADVETLRSLLLCGKTLSSKVRAIHDLIRVNHHAYRDFLNDYFEANHFPRGCQNSVAEQLTGLSIEDDTEMRHEGVSSAENAVSAGTGTRWLAPVMPPRNLMKSTIRLIDHCRREHHQSHMLILRSIMLDKDGLVDVSVMVGGQTILHIPEVLIGTIAGSQLDLMPFLRYMFFPAYHEVRVNFEHTKEIRYLINSCLLNTPVHNLQLGWKITPVAHEHIQTEMHMNKIRLNFNHISVGLIIVVIDSCGQRRGDLIDFVSLKCHGSFSIPELKVDAELCCDNTKDSNLNVSLKKPYYFFQLNGKINFSRIDSISLNLECKSKESNVNIHIFNVHENLARMMGGMMGLAYAF